MPTQAWTIHVSDGGDTQFPHMFRKLDLSKHLVVPCGLQIVLSVDVAVWHHGIAFDCAIAFLHT